MEDNLSCYFCTTPYQIMGALSIAISNNDKGDLYIVPQFIEAKECASRLQKLGIFNRVKVVDTDAIEEHKKCKNKYQIYFGIIKRYYNVDNSVRTYLFSNVIYRKIYISSMAYVGRLTCLYYIRHRLDAQIILFDDGEGTYHNKLTITPKYMDKIAQYVFYGDCISNHIKKIMLYNLDIYKNINKAHKNCPLEQIGFKQNAVTICSNLQKIFNVDQNHIIKEKVIIIDTMVSEALKSKDIINLYYIYALIYRIFGNDNVIIKPHPRNKNFDLPYKYYCYNYTIEQLCLVQDFTDKLMIALSSTSLSVPKLFFNQEPSIVLLHKIIKPKRGNSKKRDKYYAELAKSYSDDTKIYIPSNLSELEMILRNVVLSDKDKI